MHVVLESAAKLRVHAQHAGSCVWPRPPAGRALLEADLAGLPLRALRALRGRGVRGCVVEQLEGALGLARRPVAQERSGGRGPLLCTAGGHRPAASDLRAALRGERRAGGAACGPGLAGPLLEHDAGLEVGCQRLLLGQPRRTVHRAAEGADRRVGPPDTVRRGRLDQVRDAANDLGLDGGADSPRVRGGHRQVRPEEVPGGTPVPRR
mmetsp:Transcript_12879/g.34915  ORF Transcript_12879/g.34915 Transcript_12879/m.34915 type:complete len:208 (+) Transcript_12879:2215-2838(+)